MGEPKRKKKRYSYLFGVFFISLFSWKKHSTKIFFFCNNILQGFIVKIKERLFLVFETSASVLLSFSRGLFSRNMQNVLRVKKQLRTSLKVLYYAYPKDFLYIFCNLNQIKIFRKYFIFYWTNIIN